MLKKRLICVLLVAFIATGVLLSGCGGNTGEVKQAATAAENTPKAEDGAKKAEESPKAQSNSDSNKQVTITFQSWFPDKDTINDIISEFNKTNPNIKVEPKIVAYTDHYTTMKSDIAAGQGADVIALQPGSHINKYKQFLDPIEPYAKKEFGENWLDGFTVKAVNLAKSMDGNVLGLPIQYSIGGTYWYNKKMFNKYGLKVPANYDELKSVTGTLRSKNELPLLIGARDSWINVDFYTTICNDLAPGKIYDAVAGKAKWTDQEFVDAFKWWKKFFDDKIFQDGALGIPTYMDAYTLFLDGKGGMIPFGTWHFNTYAIAKDKADAGEWGIMKFPDLNGDGKPAGLWSTVGGILSINKDSKNKDAAWKFIKSMVVDYAPSYLNKKLMELPVVKGVELQGDWRPEVKDIVKTFQEWDKDVVGPREMPYPELVDTLANNLSAVAEGKVKPEEAAKAMQKAFDSISK